jgi:hypothetical protein
VLAVGKLLEELGEPTLEVVGVKLMVGVAIPK